MGESGREFCFFFILALFPSLFSSPYPRRKGCKGAGRTGKKGEREKGKGEGEGRRRKEKGEGEGRKGVRVFVGD